MFEARLEAKIKNRYESALTELVSIMDDDPQLHGFQRVLLPSFLEFTIHGLTTAQDFEELKAKNNFEKIERMFDIHRASNSPTFADTPSNKSIAKLIATYLNQKHVNAIEYQKVNEEKFRRTENILNKYIILFSEYEETVKGTMIRLHSLPPNTSLRSVYQEIFNLLRMGSTFLTSEENKTIQEKKVKLYSLVSDYLSSGEVSFKEVKAVFSQQFNIAEIGSTQLLANRLKKRYETFTESFYYLNEEDSARLAEFIDNSIKHILQVKSEN
jgi:hypothetical protein